METPDIDAITAKQRVAINHDRDGALFRAGVGHRGQGLLTGLVVGGAEVHRKGRAGSREEPGRTHWPLDGLAGRDCACKDIHHTRPREVLLGAFPIQALRRRPRVRSLADGGSGGASCGLDILLQVRVGDRLRELDDVVVAEEIPRVLIRRVVEQPKARVVRRRLLVDIAVQGEDRVACRRSTLDRGGQRPQSHSLVHVAAIVADFAKNRWPSMICQ